jgi:hypothetical protein
MPGARVLVMLQLCHIRVTCLPSSKCHICHVSFFFFSFSQSNKVIHSFVIVARAVVPHHFPNTFKNVSPF